MKRLGSLIEDLITLKEKYGDLPVVLQGFTDDSSNEMHAFLEPEKSFLHVEKTGSGKARWACSEEACIVLTGEAPYDEERLNRPRFTLFSNEGPRVVGESKKAVVVTR